MARAESSSTVNSSSVSQVRLTKAATSASASVRRWVRKRNPSLRSSKQNPRPTTITSAFLLLSEPFGGALEGALHRGEGGFGALHHLRPGLGRRALQALHLLDRLVAAHPRLVELLQVLVL